MSTKALLAIIRSGLLEPSMVYKSNYLTVLEQFNNTRKTLLEIYQVRKDMLSSEYHRGYSGDVNVYEGLDNVVLAMTKSDSDSIIFIEVRTEDDDEISLFFQENDNAFLGYIYIHT